MNAASHQPTFRTDGAPVSVLLDFDGTISLEDVGDALLARFAPDQSAVAAMDRRYDEGQVGSRDLLRWDMDVLPRDPVMLERAASAISVDASLVELVAVVDEVGGAVEVVSDGLGFHIGPMLERLGLGHVPIATNVAVPGRGGDAMAFPFGHPTCLVCGTCKRERVRIHQAAGRAVVFVGDGTSDRFAAHHADVVFAKDSLAEWCTAVGNAFLPWQRLGDVAAWLREALSRDRSPTDGVASGWGPIAQRTGQGFICGPEAWGDQIATQPVSGRRR